MSRDRQLIRLRLLADEWVVPAVCFGLVFLLVVGMATVGLSIWAVFQTHANGVEDQAILNQITVTAAHRNTQLLVIMRELRVLLKR